MSKRGKQHHGPHHIIPKSRGGGEGNNIYPNDRWPPEEGKHRHWHTLFENMRPDEVITEIFKHRAKNGGLIDEFFCVCFKVSKPWKDKGVNPTIKKVKTSRIKKRKDAWQILFGDMNVCEAIEWIKQEFIQKEWLNTPQ